MPRNGRTECINSVRSITDYRSDAVHQLASQFKRGLLNEMIALPRVEMQQTLHIRSTSKC